MWRTPFASSGVTVADFVVELRHTINLDDDTKTFFADLVRPVLASLNHLEGTVMTQFQDLRDELVGVFDDLAAKIARLQEAVDNPTSETRLSAEDQILFDEIKASVNAARTTVGDENADGVPVAE